MVMLRKYIAQPASIVNASHCQQPATAAVGEQSNSAVKIMDFNQNAWTFITIF